MSFMVNHQTSKWAGDPFAHLGVWGNPNGRANFCEEDYVITFYVAEFINSISNFAYIYLALKAIFFSPKRNASFTRPKIDFMSLALLFLGIGSFLFHASLRKTLEFVDELSMLGLSWSMLDAVFTADIKNPSKRRAVRFGLAVFHIAFCALYLYTVNIIYQVVGFLGGMIITGFKSHYLLKSLRGRKEEGKLTEGEAQLLSNRGWDAVYVSLFGYLLWNIEFMYCAELRAMKETLGLPVAWIFEFHGWWHVLTAIGAAQFMDVARDMREEVRRQWEVKKKE